MTAIAQRERVRNEMNSILAIRGPLGQHRSERLTQLLAEASGLDGTVAIEHERRYSEAFFAHLRSESISVEHRALLKDGRDLTTVGQGTGVATGPGVLVPVGFQRSITDALRAFDPIFDLATVQETSTGAALAFPNEDDTSVAGEMLAENAGGSQEDPTFSQKVLGSFKVSSRVVKVSTSLLQESAFDLSTHLAQRFAVRIGRVASQKFTTGSGNGEPLGLVTASTSAGVAIGAATNDGSSGANTLGSDDFANLIASVDSAYWSRSSFLVNASTLTTLRKTKDKQGRPVFPGLAEPPDGQPRIFGYPVFVSPSLDSLQTQATSPVLTRKPVVFGDISRYTIRRTPSVLRVLRERWAEFGQVGFILFSRMDGNLIDGNGGAVKYLETVY